MRPAEGEAAPETHPAAFISYCRDDQDFALRLAQDLKAAGAAVWLDQLDIKPGSSWDNAVEDALLAAQQMLVILTPTSVKSENVRDEISYALKQGKTVIPVLYMECIIPLRLERKQHIDFRADYARGLATLLDQLRVDHPNQAVLDKAAEGDAQRHLAWQAREAEAERRRLEEEAAQEAAARVAHGNLLHQQEDADSAPPPARHSERSEEPPHFAFQPGTPPPADAARETNTSAQINPATQWARAEAPQIPKGTQTASLRMVLWLAGGIAATVLLIFGLVLFHDSPAPQEDKRSEPAPAQLSLQPQSAAPQRPVAPPSEPQTVSQAIPPSESKHAKAITPPPSELVSSVPTREGDHEPTPIQASPAPAPNPAALAEAGTALFNSKRYAEALPWFTEACDGGNSAACRQLGYMYQFHLGVTQDYGKASSLYARACDAGSPLGCNNLGVLYADGTGVQQDYAKAFALYSKACAGGNSSGCSNLGILYSNGNGVQQDYGKAYTLFNNACGGGDANGCADLGVLYQLGHGVSANPDLARQYLQKSCIMGLAWSCDRLKEMQ